MKILTNLQEKARKLLELHGIIKKKKQIAIRTWFRTRKGKRCTVKWVDEEEHLKKIS